MGTKLKRGKAGNAVQYLTRNQAIKKLQLRLSEFRRLCILKGIHPREPKKKVQGANKTYYHVKDINWLAHEPLIQTFRQVKVHERRVRKAAAKQQLSLARRLIAAKPGYKLDHLVKERYPSFIDALRDLDDPLTMVHLFATLPAEATKDIKPATVDRCRRVVLEWNAYVARTSALRRVFVSVKGFYYQAEVEGASVTWLVPHQLSQVLPSDVDFAVMLTFLEFYVCLAQFVLFKLYHDIGLRYPPVMDRKLEEAAAGLAGIMRDIAAAAAADGGKAAPKQQQQQQLLGDAASNGGAAAAAPAAPALPEVVQRLDTLGKKIKQLQEQQQQGGDGGAAAAAAEEESDGDSDASLPDIDSGDEEDEGEEAGSSGSELEEGDEEEEEAADDDSPSQDEERQLDDAAAAAPAAGDAAAEQPAGAAAAGGGLSEVDADDDAGLCSVLLQGLTFFLAREVPREPLLFMIRSFGGVVGWQGEGSPVQESDESISYQIVDRPTQGHKYLSRSYVQPQWVFDSINHRVLMPAELYAPGVVPPPHLSPFVDNEAEGYTPEFAHTIKQLQEAARAARKAAAGRAHDAAFLGGDSSGDAAAGEGAGGAAAAAAATAQQLEAAAEKAYRQELAAELKAAAGGGSGSDEDDAPGSEDEGADGGQQQLQKQGAGAGKKRSAAAAGEGEEEAAMADIMMSRKTRKLYGRINRAIEGKAERVAALEAKKRVLTAQQQGQPQTPAAAAQQQKQLRPRKQQKK